MLHQYRGFKGKHSDGFARPKFFGNPHHGRVIGGTLTLPNSATLSTPYSHLAGAGGFGNETPNCRASIAFRPALTLVPIRTPAEAAIDAANGYTWKNYAYLVGTQKWLWGKKNTGDLAFSGSMEIGRTGWLYADPQGQVWWINIPTMENGIFYDFSGGAPATTFPSYTFRARKFGIIRSRESRGAADPIDFTYSKPFPILPWSGGLGFGTTQIRIYTGSMSLDGSKAMIYTIRSDAYSPGTVNCSAGGTFVPMCWTVTLTGTPGIDFNISIAVYRQRALYPVADPDTHKNFRLAWIDAGGTPREMSEAEVPGGSCSEDNYSQPPISNPPFCSSGPVDWDYVDAITLGGTRVWNTPTLALSTTAAQSSSTAVTDEVFTGPPGDCFSYAELTTTGGPTQYDGVDIGSAPAPSVCYIGPGIVPTPACIFGLCGSTVLYPPTWEIYYCSFESLVLRKTKPAGYASNPELPQNWDWWHCSKIGNQLATNVTTTPGLTGERAFHRFVFDQMEGIMYPAANIGTSLGIQHVV